MSQGVSILVLGDLCPTGRNEDLFVAAQTEAIYGEALSWIQGADLSVANLECPLIETPSPMPKVGPTLGASVHAVNGVRDVGIDVLVLANNHIMDHGDQGLASTLQACHAVGIETVGAGADVQAASRLHICEREGMNIGLLAMADHEFTMADASHAGANPLDVIRFVRTVRRHKDAVDYLVVLLHAGCEHYPYPNPSLQKTARFLVEEGADAVICQHSHCAGCYEIYDEAPIVYGQGNFVFRPMWSCPETWYSGFLVLLRINAERKAVPEFIPYRQSVSSSGISLLGGEEKEVFLRDMAARSERVVDDMFVRTQWAAFCEEHADAYFAQLCANSRLTRKLMTKLGFLKRFCSLPSLLLKLNLIRCELHREVLIETLSAMSRRRGSNGQCH